MSTWKLVIPSCQGDSIIFIMSFSYNLREFYLHTLQKLIKRESSLIYPIGQYYILIFLLFCLTDITRFGHIAYVHLVLEKWTMLVSYLPDWAILHLPIHSSAYVYIFIWRLKFDYHNKKCNCKTGSIFVSHKNISIYFNGTETSFYCIFVQLKT